MALLEPEPGLVISYAYLWHHEHRGGQEEGRKDRPCMIVLRTERTSDRASVVTRSASHPSRARQRGCRGRNSASNKICAWP
jgi:hypothetical protein